MTTTIEEKGLEEESPLHEETMDEDVTLSFQECSDMIANIAIDSSDDFLEVPWLKRNS